MKSKKRALSVEEKLRIYEAYTEIVSRGYCFAKYACFWFPSFRVYGIFPANIHQDYLERCLLANHLSTNTLSKTKEGALEKWVQSLTDERLGNLA